MVDMTAALVSVVAVSLLAVESFGLVVDCCVSECGDVPVVMLVLGVCV